MSARVVITGAGVVAPNGLGARPFRDACLRSENAIGPITRFDPSGYSCNAAGEVRGFDAGAWVPVKIERQTDRSVHMAIAACRMAADDASLDLTASPTEVGMSFANTLGGMEFAEPELYAQTFLGPRRVSAYQAIAWFYAAAQGQWSISNGIRGYGKSLVGDRAGGHLALALGVTAIRSGRCHTVFAGGFEAPLVPYAYLIHQTAGVLARTDGSDAASVYRPFAPDRSGAVLGEGSGMVILEESTHARDRGARVYAEVAGFATNRSTDPRSLETCCRDALARAGIAADDVDHVLAEGVGTIADDAVEAEVIRALFGRGGRTTVSVPKSMFGHTLAAAGALDAILGALMIEANVVAPTLHPDGGENLGAARHVVGAALEKQVDSVVALSRARGSVNAAIVLRRFGDEH